MSDAEKLALIAKIFEERTPFPNSRSEKSTHAYHNLGGAIIDIERNAGRCDSVSLDTLKRVEKQLGDIAEVLSL